MRSFLVTSFAIGATVFTILTILQFVGEGGFKRKLTLSGIYAICKPEGYQAVCFLDSDSKDGGLSCLPLSQVGGVCK